MSEDPIARLIKRLRELLQETPTEVVRARHLAAIRAALTPIADTFDVEADPEFGIVVTGPGSRREQLDTALVALVRRYEGDPSPTVHRPRTREEMTQ